MSSTFWLHRWRKIAAVPVKKNHEPQNGAKDGSSGEGGPEGATRPWVNADLTGTAGEKCI